MAIPKSMRFIPSKRHKLIKGRLQVNHDNPAFYALTAKQSGRYVGQPENQQAKKEDKNDKA